MGKFVFLAGLFFLTIGFFFIFKPGIPTFGSPIPKVIAARDQIKVINDWFPKTLPADNEGLNLTAKSVLLVDYDSGEVLYQKNVSDKLPAASTVKIMTALLVLEGNKLSDTFTVSKKGAEVGEDSMGLTEGEKLSVEELLYGLMLPSGNDAAVTIAEGVYGSEDEFVKQMNIKARQLGADDTKFINASGLDVDGETQYTTAVDLATIAHYTWETQKAFRRITSTERIFLDATDAHKAFDLTNDTNLLTTYPGVRGIKPGFTWESGLCLVTYAENNGKKLLGVILGSANRRFEMAELLDFGFSKYGIKVDHPALDL